MFSNSAYLAVNREERFYCFLLGHLLLASGDFRQAFCSIVAKNHGLNLDPNELQVFPEAAALRDYWYELGDPAAYSEETRARRREVIIKILNMCSYNDSLLQQYDFFWTSKCRRKLWSPGRWNEKAIKEAGLKKLLEIKWAFNSKPDLLLMSPGNVLLLEAKLASREGRDNRGYNQFAIQQLVATMLSKWSQA